MHPEHGKEERAEEEMTAIVEAVIVEALSGQAVGNEDQDHKKRKGSLTGKSQSAGSSVDDESAESKRKKVWRVMLTPEQAKGIYLRRPSLDEVCFCSRPTSTSQIRPLSTLLPAEWLPLLGAPRLDCLFPINCIFFRACTLGPAPCPPVPWNPWYRPVACFVSLSHYRSPHPFAQTRTKLAAQSCCLPRHV